MGVNTMFHRTENLFLRPGFTEDWKAIHAGIARMDVVRNLASAPWPYDEKDARYFAEKPQDSWVPHFLIQIPDEGVIGSAGLGYDDATGDVQLGYWIAPAYWGRGIATEASRGVLEIARMIGHRRITASHFVDNPASGKVLSKAGFRKTGEIRPGYSLARGGHDMVACYEIFLASDENDGGDEDDAPMMKQAA